MADMITRCPKCGTAFRISDALLKSAKGVVRCGSCLSVFNAREHLEAGKTTVANPPVRTPRSQPPQPSPLSAPRPATQSKSTSSSVSFFEHAEEDDEVDMPDWRRRSGQDDAYPPKDLLREQDSTDPDVDDDEDDEAWALELLKDDDDLNIQLKKVTPKPAVTPPAPPASPLEDDTLSTPRPDLTEAFAEIDEQLAPMAPAYQAPEETFSESDIDEAYTGAHIKEPITEPNPALRELEYPARHVSEKANHVLGEAGHAPGKVSHEPGKASHEPGKISHVSEKVSHAPEEAGHVAEEADDELDSPPEPPPEPSKRKPIRPKLEPKSTPLKDVIASLEPEPLEVDWQEPGAWRRRLLWPLLALIALLCLLAQVAWLEFDRLSRVEPYRSAYSVACQIVGCELPELLDRSQIQTSNLLVRSHPDVIDALQVDVILQNNAPFEQTFPVLELTFTNLRSEPVATRRLEPSDYLGGELAGRDKMPVRQPIHIALEIADPGSEAVSYHITIVE